MIVQRIIWKLEPFLIRLYDKCFLGRAPNISGDRNIEWSWVAANLPKNPGKALDFGCGESPLALITAQRGFETIAIDLTPVRRLYVHPNLQFIQKDIFNLGFPPQTFDLIINCSSIEHVGLVGRYMVKQERPDGDIEAMLEMRKLLKQKGIMLLTLPVGQDIVFAPFHRVYGEQRLPKLLDAYIVIKEEYWTKNTRNQWVLTEKSKALGSLPKLNCYGLGCFILWPK